ncbi:uncharacterized protein PGTG_17188 [Puccinia graminis f. sp. tritici CRL 75-36-700-3]|uniref:Uncharacterized protein n=1 Tax=Puccinia graminis f. sp. tritici (strain CRL 75-36-700-3 / race SCCL) TaxID=418459 RepID=E3L2Z1_PUCGT|nr:uncharacterized protein PGTG_17188 [Puccinia graminis f. sp. tritici CRL 75-36-700-3]EFP90916.2 hypothetical protein PGTG_17188 [Puccinia graminis f. sp. tritici CRL 75-36-700-3]
MRANQMSTDQQNCPSGPTLPPLRPFYFSSNPKSVAQFSSYSLSHSINFPAHSASPMPQLSQSSPPPSTHSSARRDRDQDKQFNPIQSQPSVDRLNSISPCSGHRGDTNSRRASQAHLITPTASDSNLYNQRLKRSANRAELDHHSAHGNERFVHSEVHTSLKTQTKKSKNDHIPQGNSQVRAEPPPSDSETHKSNPPHHLSPINSVTVWQAQQDVKPIEARNSIKGQQMTAAHEQKLIKPCDKHALLASSKLSSSSPDPQIANQNPVPKHKPEAIEEPTSPLAIGFLQPQNLTAMQQVIKLREEQKQLIEQRRNSSAGHSCLNSASLSCSVDQTIAAKIASSTHNKKNGLMKLIWHPESDNHTPSSNNLKPQKPPPNINVSSIKIADFSRQKSVSYQPHQKAAQNHQTHSSPVSNSDNPKCHPSFGSGSVIASRRGQEVREKVKGMVLTSQDSQVHLLEHQSIKSAPICSGFLQVPPQNEDVTKMAQDSPKNMNGQQEITCKSHVHNFQQPFSIAKVNSQLPNLNHGIKKPMQPNITTKISHDPGPGHPHFASFSSSQGLERRKTIHAGSVIQVPSLTHLMNKQSQSHGSVLQTRQSDNLKIQHAKIPPSDSRSSNTMPTFSNSKESRNQHQDRMNEICSTGNQSNPCLSSKVPDPQACNTQLSTSSLTCPQQAPHHHSVASAGGPGIPPKHLFLQLFETFYDSLSDCQTLQSNLEDQKQRSDQLINLLQQSSGVFEKMLEDRIATLQRILPVNPIT